MAIQRTSRRALPVLVAAMMTAVAGATLAQSPPAGTSTSQQTAPQTAPQGDARDLLGRARSSSEGQMVEDLIRRLQGPAGAGSPATGSAPTAPTTPAAPGVAPPPRVATPPAATTPPRPPAVTAPAAHPAATPPSAAPPPTQQAQPRRMPRPIAAPGTRAPLQAPLPDSIAAPTSPSTPAAGTPPAAVAAPSAATDPPSPLQPRLAPLRRAVTQPVAPPPEADAPPAAGRVVRQVPITRAQIERMDVLPHIDVEVLFFLESARLTNRAFATLAILGRALSDERLGTQVFLIAGHTDASGPPDYNLALSEQRAHAVRDFLIENFGIAPERLLARGFGPSRLKNPHSPDSRVNRRVQIVNWTSETDPSAAGPASPQRR